MTHEELSGRLASIRRVKLATPDIDGVLRGKYISKEKFLSSARSGLGFCDVIFGWDIADVLYDNVAVTGWHSGYPDAKATVDLDTFRVLPWEPETAFFLADVDLPMAPRGVLRRVAAEAKARGFSASFAAEYEFFCFRETPESLRQKAYRGLTPLSPGMFGYSVLRATENRELLLDWIDALAAFACETEGFHTETGPGVYEAAIAVQDVLEAADRASLFKTAVKEIASRHGIIPTFMAKWNASLPGSSGHLHQSLSAGGKNLFSDPEGGMTETMRHYLGGLVAYLPEFAAVFCPTINSYKRTVPGAWAPINATWGLDNRTTAVRTIPSAGKSARIELRLTGADIQPHLAMAAALAAGLEGIANSIEPPPPTVNAYDANAERLPGTLAEATARFRASQTARRWFGDAFVDHYANTRDWEVRQYEKAVTDWELDRYFESI